MNRQMQQMKSENDFVEIVLMNVLINVKSEKWAKTANFAHRQNIIIVIPTHIQSCR